MGGAKRYPSLAVGYCSQTKMRSRRIDLTLVSDAMGFARLSHPTNWGRLPATEKGENAVSDVLSVRHRPPSVSVSIFPPIARVSSTGLHVSNIHAGRLSSITAIQKESQGKPILKCFYRSFVLRISGPLEKVKAPSWWRSTRGLPPLSVKMTPEKPPLLTHSALLWEPETKSTFESMRTTSISQATVARVRRKSASVADSKILP
jgi:hypothetical protein